CSQGISSCSQDYSAVVAMPTISSTNGLEEPVAGHIKTRRRGGKKCAAGGPRDEVRRCRAFATATSSLQGYPRFITAAELLEESDGADSIFCGPPSESGDATSVLDAIARWVAARCGFQEDATEEEIWFQLVFRGSQSAVASGIIHIETLFARTKICKFEQRRECTRGSACNFAHNFAQLRQQPDFAKTRLCIKYLQSGECPDGEECNFAHHADELRPSTVKEHHRVLRRRMFFSARVG
ncbi:unnamed protein product, partial [Polarella glacialis]